MNSFKISLFDFVTNKWPHVLLLCLTSGGLEVKVLDHRTRGVPVCRAGPYIYKASCRCDWSACLVLQVSIPVNGADVSLKLVLLPGESGVPRLLSINISVQAMRHNGSPAENIQSEQRGASLQPGKGDSPQPSAGVDPTRPR